MHPHFCRQNRQIQTVFCFFLVDVENLVKVYMIIQVMVKKRQIIQENAASLSIPDINSINVLSVQQKE